jgi:hypothetical protein
VYCFGDEHDVDVARVVELLTAALAHRDHGEPARRGVGGQPRPGDRERGIEGARCEVGQFGGHVADFDGTRQVARGESQHSAPVGDPQRVPRVGHGGHRFRSQEVGAHRGQHLGPQPGCTRAHRAAFVRVAEQPPVLGMAHQVLTQRAAGTQHIEQPTAQPHVAVQLVDEVVAVDRGLEQQRQTGQSRVGVRRCGQSREQAVVTSQPGQRRRVEQHGSLRRLGEANSCQLRRPAPRHSAPT